jgi:hypothetical protein
MSTKQFYSVSSGFGAFDAMHFPKHCGTDECYNPVGNSDFCPTHTCSMFGCINQKSEYVDFCKNHLCPICGGYKIAIEKGCKIHTCSKCGDFKRQNDAVCGNCQFGDGDINMKDN